MRLYVHVLKYTFYKLEFKWSKFVNKFITYQVIICYKPVVHFIYKVGEQAWKQENESQ